MLKLTAIATVLRTQATPAPTAAPTVTIRRGVRTTLNAPLTSTRHS
jgi:hypothetical protein